MIILPNAEINTSASQPVEPVRSEVLPGDRAPAVQEKQDQPKGETKKSEQKKESSKDDHKTESKKHDDTKKHEDSKKHESEKHNDEKDHDHDKEGHGKDGHDDKDHSHGPRKSLEDMNFSERLSAGMEKYLDPGHLFEHVQDADYVETPRFLGMSFTDSHGHEKSGFKLPNPLGTSQEKPLISVGEKSMFNVIGKPTKFMALEFLGAIILVVLFVGLARRIQGGKQVKGRFWNLLETFVMFVRDEIARPAIGKKDTDKFLPFLLTLFFFILVLNLLGMIPSLGSATGAISVTAVFAIATFIVVVGSGMKKMGVVGFLKAQVPTMDLPAGMSYVLIPLIFVIEIFGLMVKHFVLAVRLFANMFAGHLVLIVLVSFVGVTFTTWLVYVVGPMAVLGTVAFSMLELFVAFLQAYVFTFLAALFIGSAQHAH